MKKSIIHVTDHAVLRYLERVEGMDIEKVRREIGRRVDLLNSHPGATAVRSAGVRYVIRDLKVVTVTASGSSENGPDQ